MYYEILEVNKESDIEEIKKKRRELILKWHPDKRKQRGEEYNDDITAKIALINKAYGVLSDPEKKECYDNYQSLGDFLYEDHIIEALIIKKKFEKNDFFIFLAYFFLLFFFFYWHYFKDEKKNIKKKFYHEKLFIICSIMVPISLIFSISFILLLMIVFFFFLSLLKYELSCIREIIYSLSFIFIPLVSKMLALLFSFLSIYHLIKIFIKE